MNGNPGNHPPELKTSELWVAELCMRIIASYFNVHPMSLYFIIFNYHNLVSIPFSFELFVMHFHFNLILIKFDFIQLHLILLLSSPTLTPPME